MEDGIETMDRRECTIVFRVKAFLCFGNGVVVSCFGMSDWGEFAGEDVGATTDLENLTIFQLVLEVVLLSSGDIGVWKEDERVS